jgi:trk system potassium uptake protein TrkA
MRILIVGAGAIGSNLAEELAEEHNDVVVVENNHETARALAAKIDAMVVEGNGASPAVLEKAGIREAEMVIAVSNSDELNMIVCLLAANYGVKTRVARIRNPDYAVPGSVLSQKQLNIDKVINPEAIAVDAMEALVFTAGATEIAHFADKRVLLMVFLVPEDAPIAGRTLRQIREVVPDEFLIAAIQRGEDVIIPHGDEQVLGNDRIHVIIPRDLVDLFLGQLFRRVKKVRKVVICGATRLGISLARRLHLRISDVTLIDPSQERCLQASGELEGVTVLHGSPLDPDLIEEVRLKHAQVFCSVQEDDAANVMSALLAKEHEAGKTIVYLSEPDFVPIAERIGLDAVINPRLLAVDAILKYVRGGPVLSVAHFDDLKAEVQEIVPVAGSAVVNRPLRDVAPLLPRDALIGAVVHGEEVIIPRGETIIEPGERVIVFATETSLPEVRRLFTEPADQ